MSILDKLKEPQTVGRPSGAGSRRPDAVSPARDIARIGDTITILGDVTGAESLVVDCRVDGSVHLPGYDLTIGRTGRVSAGATARLVRVEGELRGDVVGTEKVVVTGTGRVFGDIVAPRVILEEGARFRGSIDMDCRDAEVRPEKTGPVPAGVSPRSAKAPADGGTST